MSKTPLYWNKAKKYLSKKDKVMKKLIEKYSDASLTTRKNIFLSLCNSIIGCLLYTSDAADIYSV